MRVQHRWDILVGIAGIYVFIILDAALFQRVVFICSTYKRDHSCY